MAAGLSPKQINSRTYRRLKRLQSELIKAGLDTAEYRNWTVQVSSARCHFKAFYRVGNASNGETFGMLRTHLMVDGVTFETDNVRTFPQLAKFVYGTFKAAYLAEEL